jgi:hypothetical protein
MRTVLPDGTIRYKYKGHGAVYYKPPAESERKNRRHKPDAPGYVLFHDDWYGPLPLIPDEDRVLPETVPDGLGVRHRAWCRCKVCKTPEGLAAWRLHRGLGGMTEFRLALRTPPALADRRR